MHTIDEINARLAAIQQEVETATGDALRALNEEADALIAERTQLQQEAATRQAVRSAISNGAGTATVVTPVPAAPAARAAAPAAQPSVEELEARAFEGFLRGALTQMREDPVAQNYSVANNGAVIPETIANRIIQEVRDQCPIFARAEIYRAKGTIKVPVYGPKTDENGFTHDITVAYGEDFQELAADAGAFTSIDLGGFLMGALTLIGQTLITNSQIDIVSFAISHMASQIAIFIEHELLQGDGASNGHMTGALSTTNNLNAGSTSNITADKLIELQAKIKQVYQGGACWTMHPDTWTLVKKLKDNNNRYLVQDDFTSEFPYRLLGKPVYLSDNMPTVASGAKAILYGDYNGLSINIHEGIAAQVLREKYATQHALGIVAWFEMDSKVTDAQKLVTLTMSA